MFEIYDAIFNQRGEAYHRAMTLFPHARRNEFRLPSMHVALRPGDVICDIPSGGGYLLQHLPADLDLRLVAIDPSEVFAKQWSDEYIESHLAPLHRLPLDNASVDAIISIAGLHHAENRLAVFREMRRVLRPGGRLCILEVAAGSITDRFLNGFVHSHNSMGHEGRFVDDGFRNDLELAGWQIQKDQLCRYTWDFPDEAGMVDFMRLMFGLDRAEPGQVSEGVDRILGMVHDEGGTKVNWELQLLVAT